MSAFVISDKHINSMLSWANRKMDGISYGGKIYSFKNTEDLQAMAQAMLNENYRSVNFRYAHHGHTEPHEIIFNFEHIHDPVQVIKACHCFNYQCCETSDWEKSFAYIINEYILSHATRCLPGYDDAEWEIR